MSDNRICDKHVRSINDELSRKGLLKFCADDPQEISRRAQLWLHGATTDATWDPRVIAFIEIQAKARQLYQQKVGGTFDTCPLCEVNKLLRNAGADASWIDNITDLLYIQLKANVR